MSYYNTHSPKFQSLALGDDSISVGVWIGSASLGFDHGCIHVLSPGNLLSWGWADDPEVSHTKPVKVVYSYDGFNSQDL